MNKNHAFTNSSPENLTRKKYFNILPWLTPELKNDIKHENKRFKYYKNTRASLILLLLKIVYGN